jgi:CDP-glycerol glycerophosphotransferase
MPPLPPPVTKLRRVVRKVIKTAPIEWRAYTRRLPVRPEVVLYEAFAGNGVLCNPEALFRTLLADPDQAHLKHVWALKDPKHHAAVLRELADHPRVSFVKYRSPAYFKALSTAGLLVNNATFPPEFNKRPGQVYVNTWHGTPLKHMGYDEPQGAEPTRNVIRNFVMADYLLSSGEFMTRQMYESAFRLVNIYRGRILEYGFPRTDRQFLDEAGRRGVLDRLRRRGIDARGRIVLYAPTWRGESFYAPNNDARLLGERIRRLREDLPADTTVLLKVHQQVYEFAAEQADLSSFLVPNDIPTNEVLAVTDVLVTDYSSVFFDFLDTGRPILFFTPDREDYSETRGLYLAPEELPGPSAQTPAELAGLLNALGTGGSQDALVSHASAYARARERFAAAEDGHVAERVLGTVLSRETSGPGIVEATNDGREKLLVFLGGMKSNGITTAAINLLANLDHERFDVSAVYDHTRREDRLRNAEAVDHRVRRFARVGSFAPGKVHRGRRRALLSQGADMDHDDFRTMLDLLEEEWHRCFGPTQFDYVVDFSGYSPFYAFLLTLAPAKAKSIWMHNDLLADQQREVEGHRPHEAHLRSVFSAYRYYDHLVSVSDALREINRENLRAYAPPEKFTYARNPIDHQRILRMAHGPSGGEDVWSSHPVLSTMPLAVEPELAVSESAALIAERHGLQSMRDEIERRLAIATIVPPRKGSKTFVTVGRLSPEKNHERMLRAFDLVHQEDQDTRLVLVGYGPLAEKLQRIAVELGLAQAVTFAGLQRNPFAIMANSDFFVLSSDYEGQPMVIHEARVLGLPVVTTAFGSVKGAMPEGVGLVVPRDHEALAEGMRAALRGEVPNPPFDADAYNRAAMQDFYRAIGADGSGAEAALEAHG